MLGCLIVLGIILTAIIFPNIKSTLNSNYTTWSSALEETLKFVICLYTIHKVKRFTYQILPFVGLGFGIAEQSIRLWCSNCFPWQPLTAHIIMALIMTYLLSKAIKQKHEFVYYSLALIIPIFIHIIYNIIIITIST